jgi:hypothetical protein
MKGFVGVKLPSELVLSPSLKREALMFSQIGIVDIDKLFLFSDKHEGTRIRQLRGELDWLLEQDVIFDPEKKSGSRGVTDEESAKLRRLESVSRIVAGMRVPKANKEMERRGLDFHTALRKRDDLSHQLAAAVAAGLDAEVYRARRECIRLRVLHHIDAHLVTSLGKVLSSGSDSDKHEVVEITLSSLPIPDDSTSWEQIIEYRNDPDSQSKFLALRNWMSEVVRAELTPAETEEKLEYLIDQYQQHMNLHRMKANVGVLETIATTSVEILGDLVSFQWGKAAQALFALKRRKVALLEGELTSPGNEVAYIVKARERFKGR